MVEARDRGRSTDDAIRYGTAQTGSIITAAALIMIVVAGAFGFSEIVMMKYIAFGMIFALAIDATIIRMMLVPAVMHLLREDNWWAPRFIKRAYEKMGHSEQLPPVPAPAPTPATPEPEADVEKQDDEPLEGELLIDEAVVVDHDEAARGGRTTAEDEELIPFAELMARLEADRSGPRKLGR